MGVRMHSMISPHWKPERLCRILLAHDIELPIRKSLRVHRSDPRRHFLRPAILTGLLAALTPEFINDDTLRTELVNHLDPSARNRRSTERALTFSGQYVSEIELKKGTKLRRLHHL